MATTGPRTSQTSPAVWRAMQAVDRVLDGPLAPNEAAAAAGSVVARTALGLRLVSGELGLPRDKRRAVRLLLASAEQGCVVAQGMLGVIPGGLGDVESCRWLHAAAERGASNAQCSLGDRFATGRGLPAADAAEAVRWWTRAADRGHTEAIAALHRVGKCRLLARAAELPAERPGEPAFMSILMFDTRACIACGVRLKEQKRCARCQQMSYCGLECQAAHWSLGGHKQACRGFVEEAFAEELLQADSGSAAAMFNVGMRYDEGRGVGADAAAAMRYYSASAAAGFAAAQYQLGVAHKDGRLGCARDSKRALEWFQLSAAQGFVDAQTAVGVMMRDGDGVEANLSGSARQSELAADSGSTDDMMKVLLGLANLLRKSEAADST